MTVAELIAFLETQPRDMGVLYRRCSESMTLDSDDISVQEACVARPDGWVQNQRPDKPSLQYLVFPGN